MRDSGYEKAANDFYREDRRCVDEFLALERFTDLVWDPMCGTGNIPEAVRATGCEALGTDIVDRGYGDVMDFFKTDMVVPSIVSNPAYGVMRRFIDKALASTTDRVAVLGRLAFLESQSRNAWWQTVPLYRVYVSSRRLSMPPGSDPSIKATGGTIAYAWFVLKHGHVGPATVHWI